MEFVLLQSASSYLSRHALPQRKREYSSFQYPFPKNASIIFDETSHRSRCICWSSQICWVVGRRQQLIMGLFPDERLSGIFLVVQYCNLTLLRLSRLGFAVWVSTVRVSIDILRKLFFFYDERYWWVWTWRKRRMGWSPATHPLDSGRSVPSLVQESLYPVDHSPLVLLTFSNTMRKQARNSKSPSIISSLTLMPRVLLKITATSIGIIMNRAERYWYSM